MKESELGGLYEKCTKDLFDRLGFHVDETLKAEINTSRAQMDILINTGGQDLIVVECKTLKDKNYNKYAAVSRQLNSYVGLCKRKGFHVKQVVIIANDFTEDFISECEYDLGLSISLITSRDLVRIYDGLKDSQYEELPVRLLLKGGVLSGDRIVKALHR
ncbi:MAG: restriction endonuclease [Desulfovibrionales bacterium]|nr:restriction endonuclease [Desulfovibrionales bacterium]